MDEPSNKQETKTAIIWGVIIGFVFFGVVALVYAFITVDSGQSTNQSGAYCYTESVGRYGEQEYCDTEAQDAYDSYQEQLKEDAANAQNDYNESLMMDY